MPTIAQKLCNDIVKPIYIPNTISIPRTKTYGTSEKNLLKNKPISSIKTSSNIEKKNVVNKSDSSRSKQINTGKVRSKDSILKQYVDVGNNTFITGPLQCNNNCMTMVRSRDNKSMCRCRNKKINFKLSAKEIQTAKPIKYSYTDKACHQCVETVSCGTDNENLSKTSINNSLRHSTSKSEKDIYKVKAKPKQSLISGGLNNHITERSRTKATSLNSQKPIKIKYMNTKRWAISRYPIRGPDF